LKIGKLLSPLILVKIGTSPAMNGFNSAIHNKAIKTRKDHLAPRFF